MSPAVSIVIVNSNGAGVLPACLAAVQAQTRRDFDLIVVDNGSTDGSADGLESRLPGCRVIRLPLNTGFAAANNLAAREAVTPWLALVNSDAFLAPDWLERMLSAAEAHRDFAFFASRLLQDANPAALDGEGDAFHLSGIAWHNGHGRPVAYPPGDPIEVFAPCAAAALYDRRAFLSVGGFDEDFVSYYEDVDLAFRLRLAGHRCLLVPAAAARHVGSATLGRLSDTAIYLTHRNLEWTWLRNMPPGLLFWSLPAHLLLDVAYLVRYTVGGHAAAIWRAKWHALRGLPCALRKRRDTQRQQKASSAALYQMMDTGILTPYLPGRRRQRDRHAIPPATLS